MDFLKNAQSPFSVDLFCYVSIWLQNDRLSNILMVNISQVE